ncbi:hypothetical protein [Achromobacter piechaudii]|uniref:hypothetical protein n=1 Tax=Achromobacter piechaudii TaxID=72556 RepID=UPI0012E31169|nr:hypothetical protein [Achromobacter piechaudii]
MTTAILAPVAFLFRPIALKGYRTGSRGLKEWLKLRLKTAAETAVETAAETAWLKRRLPWQLGLQGQLGRQQRGQQRQQCRRQVGRRTSPVASRRVTPYRPKRKVAVGGTLRGYRPAQATFSDSASESN